MALALAREVEQRPIPFEARVGADVLQSRAKGGEVAVAGGDGGGGSEDRVSGC